MTSVTPATASPVTGSLHEMMRRHPLFAFFAVAYAFSWVLTIPVILSEWGLLRGNYQALFVLKSFGPFVSAYYMSWVLDGREGMKQLRHRVRQRGASMPWYVFVLLGVPLLVIAGILVQPGMTAGFKGLSPILLVSYPITYLAVLFGGGPLGEEPGWRGFALPYLQRDRGPFVGTVLLGVLWACWHLPDFLISAQGGGPGTGWSAFFRNFPVFLLLVLAFALILTWVYNRNHDSVFMTMLAHASINTPQVVLVPLLPAVGVTNLNIAALIGYGVPALLIVLMTRGRLGYAPETPAI